MIDFNVSINDRNHLFNMIIYQKKFTNISNVLNIFKHFCYNEKKKLFNML